jgi:hypothetical protein
LADNGTGDDAQAVCAFTYGTYQLTNRVANFNDPNSWQCWHTSIGQLGGLDFNRYCQILGHPSAYNTGSGNAYSWYCTGSRNGIDTQDACRRLYNTNPAVSRFQNFYNPSSWQCWA